MPRARARSIATVFALAAVVVFMVWSLVHVRVVGDIRRFIPTASDPELGRASVAMASSPITRSSVLLVEGTRAIEAGTRLERVLAEHPDVAWVRGGSDERMETAVRGLYHEHRLQLCRSDLDAAGLREAAARLERELAGPRGPLVRRMATDDPLLCFLDHLMSFADEGPVRTEGGRLVTADGRAAVLFVRTRSSAFSAAPQARFQADLAAALERIRGELDDPTLTLSQSGLGRFAVSIEAATRRDITRVSTMSTACIVLLFLVLFRRLWPAVLATLPVVLGVGFGLAVCGLAFTEVHGLTLTFGGALLGVGVDYAIHLMLHLVRLGPDAPASTREHAVAAVRPGLVLGAATTMVGMSGLALTSFPAMRELALFGAVGIGASLVAALVLVPALSRGIVSGRVLEGAFAGAEALVRWLAPRSRLAWLVFLTIVVVGMLGGLRIEWQSGLRSLYAPDPALMAEDAHVREATGAVDMSRVVLAFGDDLEQALARNDAVFERLTQAKARGELAGFRSVHPWLPSHAWQQANLARLQDAGFADAFEAAFSAEGFKPGVFAPFFAAIGAAPPPLARDDLADTPIAPIVEPFVLELSGGGVVVVTWLRGQLSTAATDALAEIEGVVPFDQQAFLDGTYGRYQGELRIMLVLGLGAVMGLIILRHRRFVPSIAASLPALAGIAGCLGVAGWIDGQANFMHGASLLLVCSMGADYGVFMVEHQRSERATATTLVAAVVSALTTVFAFGLLVASENPALAAVGRSVAVGVLCALVTAPVSATIDRRAR